MKILRSKKEMKTWSLGQKRKGFSLGFVPTMGALHQGHLSLIHAAKKECDLCIVSIFVNPLQFGPKEDFSTYPRDLSGDEKKAKEAGCDLLFIPVEEEMNEKNFQTYVDVEHLTKHLCGRHRPGHFCGVTTMVTKLFHLVNPDKVYFGEKDFQQLQVIRQMVKDLDFPLQVCGIPTLRDEDGLALSSRNSRLSKEDRNLALRLPESLQKAAEKTKNKVFSANQICNWVRLYLEEIKKIQVEYVEVVDQDTLKPLEKVGLHQSGILAAAIRIGSVRLIDHWPIGIAQKGGE